MNDEPCQVEALPSRRTFLQTAALAASALPLGAPAQGILSPRNAPGAATGNPLLQWAEPGVEFPLDLWCLPRVQFWSFDNRDPVLQAFGLRFQVQITTAGPGENTLSLHAGSLSSAGGHDRDGSTQADVVHRASQLTTAGQQQPVAGSCEIRVRRQGDRGTGDGFITFAITASVAKQPLRAVKLILLDLPPGRVGFTSFEAVPNLAPVPPESLALSYPSYQGGAPIWFLAEMAGGDAAHGISFASLDTTPRQRRFVASRQTDGRTRVELIFEEDRRRWSADPANVFSTPAWELRFNDTLDAAIQRRCNLLEREAGLRPWERRTDVPAWVHDLALVVCLHGQHWSGYVHQDYAQMAASIDWVTQRIPGRNVLFFLAGWEGRYYRSYGNSVPDPRMGGPAGFRRLIDFGHGKGAHMMAMYAGNAAMPGTPGFDQYAPGSQFEAVGSLGWTPLRGYTTDWMGICGSDSEGAVWLNPGAPGWQQHLTDQVSSTVRNYSIDGAFFDTQPNFENDRRYSAVDGLRKIVGDLREESPNLMIATESWSDLTFSFLHAGQTPAGYKNWSRRYGRRFAHLAMGEPSRGSTGVHELGTCAYNFDQLTTLFDWPTLALVDTTLRDAPEKAARMVAYAKARIRRG